MKVGIFTDSYLPGVGGTERAVEGVCKGLTENGHKVCVACPKYKEEPKDCGWPVYRAKSIHLGGPNYAAFSSLSYKFKKDLEEFDPDIIHCHTVNDMLYRAIRLGKKKNVPVVATIHTKFEDCYLNDSKSRIVTYFLMKSMVNRLKKVDIITAVSHNIERTLREYGVKGEIRVVKNGCAIRPNCKIEKFRNSGSRFLKTQDDEIIFLSVGRLTRLKNFDLSFKMLANLKKLRPDVKFKFVIAGSGPDEKYLKKQVSKQGLDNEVIFTGRVSDRLLKAIYARSDLFLFPSTFDTDGLVVVESACNKTPAIVIKGSGASERITHLHNGLVCEDSLEDYIKTILQVVDNRGCLNDLAINAYNELPKTWQEQSLDYIDIYNEMLEKFKNNTKKGKKCAKSR